MRLAHRLTATPADVDEELFAQLRQHFDEKQMVELASAIAWENYLSRYNRTFGFGSDGFSEGHFCPLPVQAGR